ncbi:MAG: hypothetical protein M3362_09795 [Acidobacteriota bacterium]|nr:hypothetical protein [Acidobacteriota bacterium]
MKKLHLIFGILVLVAFLLTGQYMDRYYNHMVGVADGPRLLYRTRHIFILLAGLLNLGIGIYFTRCQTTWRKVLQTSGSALIVIGSMLFIAGFFYEPKLENLRTPLSHWGTYAVVAGTFFHLFSSARLNVPPRADNSL